MGSKWRLNIPRLGFVSGIDRLAARLLNDDEGYHYVLGLVSGGLGYRLGTPVFLGNKWTWQFTIKARNGKNFPYGHLVEPDVVPANWIAEGDE